MRSVLTIVFFATVLVPAASAQVPAWAAGTFSAAKQTSDFSQITIDQNGVVLLQTGESGLTGTYRKNRIVANDIEYRVARTDTGIKLTRAGKRDSVEYHRVEKRLASDGRIPEWAVGSYSAPHPSDGSRIRLTVAADGKVTANIGGTDFDGTMDGETLLMNGAAAKVSRSDAGIVTTRTDNGESISYTRIGGPVVQFAPAQEAPPPWAVGTFWSIDPQTKAEVSIAIMPEGVVTLNHGGGRIVSGTMNGERVTLEGVISTVSRIRNGIRLVRSDTGERKEFFLR